MATTAAAAAAAAYCKGLPDEAMFRYVHSNELETPVSLKIGTLEGSLPRLSYQDLLDDPMLKYSGRNTSKFPDLKIMVGIVDYPGECLLTKNSNFKLSVQIQHPRQIFIRPHVMEDCIILKEFAKYFHYVFI